MTDRKPDLDAALTLTSPGDSLRLYRDWAATYDTSFAEPMGYRLPALVAAAFAAAGGTGPVVDVGAGTGLVAECLARTGISPVDGVDISPDMLAVAAAKGLYRQTIVADLCQVLPVPAASYCGITSSGTFTHGHVGPEVFDELLRVAASGALFALSINHGVYQSHGFAAKLGELAPEITGLQIDEVPIYATPDETHQNQRALIVIFRKR